MDEEIDDERYERSGEDDPWDMTNEWVEDCGDPECCMNFAPHFRSECCTPEMYEAMVRETDGAAEPRDATP
jgi:hypothetical protein